MGVTTDKPVKTSLKNGGFGFNCTKKTGEDKDSTAVTNFLIEVLGLLEVHRIPKGGTEVNVRLRAVFRDGTCSEEVTIPIADLEKINWVNIDSKCIIYSDVAKAKAQRIIASSIHEKCYELEPDMLYRLNLVGLQVIEDEPIFCAGGEILRSPHAAGNIAIESRETLYTLDYAPNITEEEAAADMLELISLFPNSGRMLFAYNLLFLVRELYACAWKPPRFSIYIYGESDSRKTTLCTFLSQLYSRCNGISNPARFDSSIAHLVELLYTKNDCTIVFDDLCPSESKEIQRKQEMALIQVVRIIGDGIKPGRVNMKEVVAEKPPPKLGAIMTAEYLIKGTDSDMARFLAIGVSKPDNDTLMKLAVFQMDKPLVVSTFYRNFILWILDNYAKIKDMLREWRSEYGKSDFTAFGVKVHGRLVETHYCMNTAYIMFLEYCASKGFITEEDAVKLHKSFLQLLTSLVHAQNEQVELAKSRRIKPDVDSFDYLAFVRDLYKSGKLVSASSKNTFSVEKHDSVIHKGYLYLYGKKFRTIIEDANLNLDDVLNELQAQGALKILSGDERTVQLVVGKKKYRCYAIDLQRLN